MSYDYFPIEQSIGGIYFSPILSAYLFGFLLTWFIARILNRFRLARYMSSATVISSFDWIRLHNGFRCYAGNKDKLKRATAELQHASK